MERPHAPQLTRAEVEIAAAWELAAADLGIEVEKPGSATDDDGNVIVYAVSISPFGGLAETVCRHLRAPEDALALFRDWAITAGAFWSLLADSYRSYDRELWIATLDDWGWKADAAPPPWYTARRGRHRSAPTYRAER